MTEFILARGKTPSEESTLEGKGRRTMSTTLHRIKRWKDCNAWSCQHQYCIRCNGYIRIPTPSCNVLLAMLIGFGGNLKGIRPLHFPGINHNSPYRFPCFYRTHDNSPESDNGRFWWCESRLICCRADSGRLPDQGNCWSSALRWKWCYKSWAIQQAFFGIHSGLYRARDRP